MRIKFFGAAQEVTGTMCLIEVNNQSILLDCGLWQGRRAETYQRNLNFPFDPRKLTTMVLSHAHIDHSGNIPNLVQDGFRGNVWCTPATRNLCAVMLMDSGYIQETDAVYLNKKNRRQGRPEIKPLYTQADALIALEQFVTVNRYRSVRVADGVFLTFHNAGHILGSSIVQLDVEDRASGRQRRLVFSGDLGREAIPILPSPDPVPEADILIIESTYGDRIHETYAEAEARLGDVVRRTARRRGRVIIPAFAVGRTQEIVYALNRLEAEGDIPSLPIYVDSPLAVNITDVFRLHPEEWDDEVRQFLHDGARRTPFDTDRIHYVRDVVRSKQLNHLSEPAVIISASGMAETGRILHHLKNGIENPENTILFVGYQAENTLGRRIKDGVDRVNILGDEYRVRAEVAAIDGYSAHADRAELLGWAARLPKQADRPVFVVHGEAAAATALAEGLRQQGTGKALAPVRGESFEV